MNVLSCGFFPALQRTVEFSEFRLGKVNRARRVVNSVGGKAANVSRVLKSFGVNSMLLCFAGGDVGRRIQRILDAEGICRQFIETEAETRICQTILDDRSLDFTEIVEDSAPLSDAEWNAMIKTFRDIEANFDYIILSGTLPRHAPADIYAQLISLTDPGKVLIDSSGDPLLAALEMRPALVKINAEELSVTSGIVGEIERAAEFLRERGACAAGITNGGGSAVLADAGKFYHYKIPAVNVVSTLGCGDSVNAGTAVALGRGSGLPDAFGFGLACGSANAATSFPGVVDAAFADELSSKIRRY